ncbi:ATP-binding protein [Paenibacillus mucilaginosus]|uniref:histidine kinase n=1 Tax=Paenibacillus mucilaginosus (strain KNP414) TaxID=1036673 RepID=F8FN48_PAEMK|nr:ATP-binding protein [Paenibacillus mucilaginosus]AEI45718.1 sporulation kinase [Paenibacillus mucilaginosus KNP414]MCG7215095.1 ATP-binding protein [Paenibacillus mucilaginosus]WDM27105.1 two-component sensor histidine kinase [Paenibacillus mucilaginosus]
MRHGGRSHLFNTGVFIAGILLQAVHLGVLYLLGGSWAMLLWSMVTWALLMGGFLFFWMRCGTPEPIAREESAGQAAEAAARRQEQADQLAIAGTLAAGIAHEIRNPLTCLRGFTQLYGHKQPQYKEIMLSEIDRINEIVGELLELAKPKEPVYEPRSLPLLLQGVVTLMRPQANMYSVGLQEVYKAESEQLRVNCSYNKLKQVFINLIQNALEATPEGGEVVVKLTASGTIVTVEIADQGPGIPPEGQHRLGQPFFSTKEKGTGLGLMICRRIVQDHEGVLEFHNRQEGGTNVTVKLPLYGEYGG